MEGLQQAKVAALIAASNAARERGDLADAVSHISGAIFLRPSEPALYAARAELLLELCDFSTALANLSKAVALTNRRDEALVARLAHMLDARGLTLLDEADYSGAVTAFSEALSTLEPLMTETAAHKRGLERRVRERQRAKEAAAAALAAAVAAEATAEGTPAGADTSGDENDDDNGSAVAKGKGEEASELPAELDLSKAMHAFRLHRALAYIGLGWTSAAIRDLLVLTEDSDTQTSDDSSDSAETADERAAMADALFLLARMQLKSGKLADSHASLCRALAVDPSHMQGRALHRLMCASAKVYEEEATRLMLLGLQHTPKAIDNLGSAIALDPSNPALHKRRALAHKQAGNPEAAAADLEAAIRLSGGSFPEAERLLSGINNDAAVAEANAGRNSSALEFLERALERDATNARYFVNRADIARRLDNAELAMADYEKARALCAPGSARRDDELAWEVECKIAMLHYEAGTRSFNRTDYAQAFEAFSAAIGCNPRVAHFFLARAEVASTLKRWDVVRADAESALALAPNDAKARAMLSRVVPA